jgi:hypothetical protein
MLNENEAIDIDGVRVWRIVWWIGTAAVAGETDFQGGREDRLTK